MTFRERERQRLVALRDRLFKDPGSGTFFGRPREFVLDDPGLNLWEGIRQDALAYFADNRISWWSQGDSPTDHLLSSQIACVNHLYLLRQRSELATAVLQSIDPEITEAVEVDTGYVEFEFIGDKPYLNERGFTRGAHCTSVDAFMIGRTAASARRAFLIEWKYTESYRGEDLYKAERGRVYDHLISSEESPFANQDPRVYYYEPFYQLMRQTLLGCKLVENDDHHCASYRHVHVIPDGNAELHRNITSPGLAGANLSEAWRLALKHPEFYIPISPERLLRPALEQGRDARSLSAYLSPRYWSGD
jgi:hypothetical protein